MTDIRKAAEEYRSGTGWNMAEGSAVADAFIAGAEWMREQAAQAISDLYLENKEQFGLHLDSYQEGILDALDKAEQFVRKIGESND